MYTYDVILKPSPSAFEDAGFLLTHCSSNTTGFPKEQIYNNCESIKISCTPDGWSLGYRRGVGECLIDRDGFLRCMIEGHTFTLVNRYSIFEKKWGRCLSICFGDEQEILYEQEMKISYMDSRHLFYDFDTTEERERLRKAAEAFADENYPDWRNVNAYWHNKKADPYCNPYCKRLTT